MLKRFTLLAALALSVSAFARPFTANDLVSLDRISEPTISPDGRKAAFSLRETDLQANRGRFDIFLLDLTVKEPQPVRFQASADSNETSPVFSKDGSRVYFLSTRGGSSQVWVAPVSGEEARQVTKLPVDVSGFKLSPTGDRIAIWAEAAVDCADLNCAAERANIVPQGSARTFDHLFVRHWDAWAGPTRSRLFTVALSPDGTPATTATPVSGKLVGDVPSKPMGGGEEIAWAPDGKTLYFALREAGRTEPWSTNLDIFAAKADGSGAPVNLTKAHAGTDTLPAVSPDGRTLAWASMARAAYESDRQVIWLRDLATGKVRALTDKWDSSVNTIEWAPDSKSIYATATDVGQTPLFRIDVADGRVTKLIDSGTVSAFVANGRGGLATVNSLGHPDDLYRLGENGKWRWLTRINARKLDGVEFGVPEQFSFKGANGDTVYGYVVKPAGLAAGAKAPVAMLIHGGPQVSFGNSWSYRWNPDVFAGAGYAAVMIDFHGSTGYGQAFTDSINKDWGGKPLEDLKLGLAAAVARYPWLDASRACALGGSYGGFMVNWIAGQWADGFKCLVNHAGIFDQRSIAYSIDELWFTEWDMGGPYFQAADIHERWNPANHVTAWETPMLVTQGEQDFRIPYLQSIMTFTALQRRGIDSRLVVFPDENHWILKPANSLQWHREVLGWLDKYLKK